MGSGPGDSAMTITRISRASLLQDAKFGWGLVPLPTGPKGEYSVTALPVLVVFVLAQRQFIEGLAHTGLKG